MTSTTRMSPAKKAPSKAALAKEQLAKEQLAKEMAAKEPAVKAAPVRAPKGLAREQNVAYIYLTCGYDLMVFRQTDFPESGLQIPGGPALEDEEPEAAALRSFSEATGLTGLQDVTWLGEATYVFTRIRTKYTRNRHFFHATVPELRQKRWSATGPSPDGSGRPIRLGFFVTPVFNGELALADELDAFLPAVRTRVRATI